MIFCNPDFIDSRKLYHLLTGVLDLNASAFGRVYEDLQSSFERTSESPFLDDFVRRPVALVNPDLLPGTSLTVLDVVGADSPNLPQRFTKFKGGDKTLVRILGHRVNQDRRELFTNGWIDLVGRL
jgi:hypothetical protein